jgi:hypothetical protein
MCEQPEPAPSLPGPPLDPPPTPVPHPAPEPVVEADGIGSINNQFPH